jgi:hypothetical protein
MHKRIATESPHLQPVPNACAVENKIIQRAAETGNCYQDARQHRADDVHPNEHRGYIDGIATHPRNRPIIIGGGDPEHAFN